MCIICICYCSLLFHFSACTLGRLYKQHTKLHVLIFAAPSKALLPPPPPPPPPGGENKDDMNAVQEQDEGKELHFELLGYPVKILKLPPIPNWLGAILEYRFPSSIDPFTGESFTRTSSFRTKAHSVLENDC